MAIEQVMGVTEALMTGGRGGKLKMHWRLKSLEPLALYYRTRKKCCSVSLVRGNASSYPPTKAQSNTSRSPIFTGHRGYLVV